MELIEISFALGHSEFGQAGYSQVSLFCFLNYFAFIYNVLLYVIMCFVFKFKALAF